MARVEPQEIPVDRDLLNPKFEQYKLSLDDIPVKEYAVNGHVLDIPLKEDHFSFQQLKAVSQLNALVLDVATFGTDYHVYYINEDMKIVGHFLNQVPAEQNQFIMADLAPIFPSDQIQFPITFLFPDSTHVFGAGGSGSLFLADTGNRGCLPENPWNVQQIQYDGKQDLILQYASSWIRDSSLVFEAVVLFVEEDTEVVEGESNGDAKKTFSTNLEWLTISKAGNNWKVERVRRLASKSAPDYVAVEPKGAAISVAGPHQFRFLFDSVSPVQEEAIPEEEMDITALQAPDPEYTWMQSADDLTVHFMVPTDTKKPDLHFLVTGKTIKFVHASGKVLLEGELHSHVDVDSSTWTLSGNKIELTLAKKSGEDWKHVVVGDKRGKQVFSNQDMEEFNQRLAAFTSDKWITAKDIGSFNVQELEECDATFDTDILNSWTRFDGETHRVTHKMDLCGNHFLFKTLAEPNRLPGAYLRYDVDALLIQPLVPLAESNQAWKHVSTFDALGYVLASKEQKKFGVASPGRTYAAVCDSNRNIFIYRNEHPLESILKNRKTGEIVKTIGKQHVYSLEKPGPILGFAATNHSLYVLKADSLVVLLL